MRCRTRLESYDGGFVRADGWRSGNWWSYNRFVRLSGVERVAALWRVAISTT